MRPLRTLALLAPFAALTPLALLAACGDDEPAVEPSRYELADGTRVEVAVDGSIALTLAGRDEPLVLPATIEGATFTMYANELLGSYAFTRDEEVRARFDTLRGSGREGDDVRVTLAAKSGAELDVVIATATAGEATRVRLEPKGEAAFDALSFGLACDEASTFYGFGAQYNATNQRGEAFPLFVSEQGIGRTGEDNTTGISGGPHSTYYPMPYFVDARGFGVLAETYARVLVDLCATNPAEARLEAEQRGPLEIVLFHGPTGHDVVRELGDVVGRPARPPSWATLPWMGAQGGRDAVLAEVDALEAAEIPVGAMWVQDWTGIRMNADGGFGVEYRWEADDALYPELAAMVSDLHARGLRFLAYANPFVDKTLPNHFDAMASAGLLVKRDDGEPYVFPCPAGPAGHPDFTVPAARDYVKAALGAMVDELGFDGWMADFGEWTPIDAAPADGSDPVAYHNRYPELWHAASREVMDERRPDGDWVVFTRSGHLGDPRVAQVVWVGDQEADFEPEDGLPTVVPAMLNLGLSGLPYVTHDVAGFSGGPSTKELFLRWTELGAFSPILRTHDGNKKLENWRWNRDAETTAHFRRFARVHVALAPTIEAAFDEAAASSKPVVRHLAFEFPDQPELRDVSDAFLLGDSLLVAPVLEAGATSREVVLPAGATWFDVWTGEALEGGQTLVRAAPIGAPPVFSRDADRADLRAIE